MLYENILDEAMYIARGSEGAVSLDWVMNQPVFVRKKYYKQMKEEVAERTKAINQRKSGGNSTTTRSSYKFN